VPARSVSILIALAALTGCGPATGTTSDVPASPDAQASAALPKVNSGTDANLTVGTHTFTGTLHTFMDSGYPMFSLEVGPADAGEGDPRNLSLLFNNEGGDGSLQMDTIQPMVGKPVEVTYEVATSIRMLDVLDGNTSILVPEPEFPRPAPAPTDKTITGVLSGIQEVEGDLPTELTVTAADGSTVTFQHFVGGSGLENANGKTVTLRYADDLDVSLVAIKATP
jgi:hypothetical protein